MYTQPCKQRSLALLVGMALLATVACHQQDEPAVSPKVASPKAAADRNEIPAAELSAVMEAHFQGVGLMEQYEYGKAAKAFREVRGRAPGWVPGAINLAIALLNMTGAEVESAKQTGGGFPGKLRRGPAAPLLGAGTGTG